MSAQPKNRNVVFRRIGGRVVPIAVKNEASAAREIVGTHQNRVSIGKILAASAAGLAAATGAGKLFKISGKMLETGASGGLAVEKVSKFLKFSSTAVPGIAVGTEMTKLDKRTVKDEKANFLNLNSQGTVAKTVVGLGIGFGFYRLTKRFEALGKYGKFSKRLRDL